MKSNDVRGTCLSSDARKFLFKVVRSRMLISYELFKIKRIAPCLRINTTQRKQIF